MNPLRRVTLGLCLVVSAVACGDPEWVGTYTTTGHWNLSGPLADGRSAGDAVADLLIDQLASHAPLPDGAKEDLAVELNDLFRPQLRALVDERAPPELRAGGSLTNLLATSLVDVQVESTLTLEEGGDGVEGTESFDAFVISDGQRTHRFVPSELGATEILAEWNGEVNDTQFELEPHEVGIQYGALVRLAAGQLIAAADLQSVEAGVLAAIDCSYLVAGILDGRSEIEINLGLFSATVDAGTLTDACQTLRDLVEGQALGLFAIGSAVELGGPVLFTAESDQAVELLQGDSFGGHLKLAPAPIAPKVFVRFVARKN